MYEEIPYLHYLRNHVGDLMKLYMRLFDWGYDYFSTNAGEHLNKRIKQTELSHTNMDEKGFFTIMHIFRTKQFEFTHSIMPSKSKPITCSACNQQGHKNNKSCTHRIRLWYLMKQMMKLKMHETYLFFWEILSLF
eukprot:TCONS_00035092-protein